MLKVFPSASLTRELLLTVDKHPGIHKLDHKAKKRVATDSALTKLPPTQEERFLIHDLYLEYSKYDDPQNKTNKPDDVEWMADTKMSAVHIMQPQDRNIHDKVRLGDNC